MNHSQFINGQFQDGQGAPEPVFNPATGQQIASLASASRAQVAEAVAAAEAAFVVWSKMTPGDRSRLMLRIADRIEQLADEFAQLEMINCGKPLGTARAVDVGNTVDVFRFYAGAARTIPDSSALLPAIRDLLRNPAARAAMGERGRSALASHRGATGRTVELLFPRV